MTPGLVAGLVSASFLISGNTMEHGGADVGRWWAKRPAALLECDQLAARLASDPPVD